MKINCNYLIHKCQCCPHVETSQFICKANQWTGFYMRTTLAFNGLNILIGIGSIILEYFIFFHIYPRVVYFWSTDLLKACVLASL